jgi:beta-mannosidase
LHSTGPVRISSLKVLCREANADRATLDLEAELETAGPAEVAVDTTIRRADEDEVVVLLHEEQALAAGANQVRWRVPVERPQLWWPWALGGQPLYDVEVEVRLEDGVSDRRVVTTGLRQVQVSNFIATVNGERLFLKGANCGPTSRALAEVGPDQLARDVCLAREAGLDLIRVHAHITRGEVYETADRLGMLIWQDLPLQWGYGQVRRQAGQQARQAVLQLGHHPSIALWCGHNEPVALDAAPGRANTPRNSARMLAGQLLPSWNKTALDRTVRRALERADGSREVVAHSGVVPHPAWGTDSHFYYGWYHGDERDFPAMMSRFPVLARFVSEFGAQAVPNTDDFIQPERWPDLDWEDLEAHYAFQPEPFTERVPPGAYPTFDAWRRATQDYQARLLRYHIEALRRLKYRPTGGFCLFLLADAQPAISWSVLDHQRSPKSGYAAVKAACAPVIVTADRPAESYRPGDRFEADVHIVSDLRAALPEAEATAALRWPGGERRWRFAGEVPADTCTRIGRVSHILPSETPAGPIVLELAVRWAEGGATNTYESRVS